MVTKSTGSEHDEALIEEAEAILARPRALSTASAPVARSRLAGMIDHTLLKADATPDMVAVLCGEAIENGFASVWRQSCECGAVLPDTRGIVGARVLGGRLSPGGEHRPGEGV